MHELQLTLAIPTEGHTRSRVLRAFVWVAVLLIFGVGLYLVLGPEQETKPRPVAPITITTATAETGNIGVYQEAIGTVTPVYTASIFSQVTGVVTSGKLPGGPAC